MNRKLSFAKQSSFSLPKRESFSMIEISKDKNSYFFQSNILTRLSNNREQNEVDEGYENHDSALVNSPVENSEKVLRYLDCSNWNICSDELSLLAEAILMGSFGSTTNYPLEHIDLSMNRICNMQFFNFHHPDYHGLSLFVNTFMTIAKHCRLWRLSLSQNILNEEGFRIVSELISHNGPWCLHELILKYCGGNAMSMKYIARGLVYNKLLILLDLNYNDIGPKGALYLSEGLRQNKRLKTLFLCSCSIGQEGTKFLSRMLQLNSSLLILTLGGNNIGDLGAVEIGEALEGISSLQHLDLQENEITSVGLESIANGLQKNSSLIFLGLKFNKIYDKGNLCLESCVEINSTLKHIHLLGNFIIPETLKIVMSSRLNVFPDNPIEFDII